MKLKKCLLPVVAGVITLCLILSMVSGCTPAATTDSQQELPISSPSLGEIFDPSGNPFAHRFSDVTDLRATTFIVAASDSEHKYEADYFCDGVADDIQIQAAVDALPATGGCIFLLDGTFTLANQIARAIDDVKFMGCGQATLLNLDGGTAVITAGVQDGWLFTHFATDAGGPSIATATQSAIRSVWIAGVRTDDPAAAAGGDALITVAADDTPAAQKDRADFTCSGADDDATIEALVAADVTVKLMVGTYVFGASLDITVSNFRLEGSGWGTVISGVVAVPYIKIGDNATPVVNVTICDLRIDGASQTAGAGIHGDGGSSTNRLENIHILNCRIANTFDEGIDVEYLYDSIIGGNYVEGVGDEGIKLDNARFSRVVDNYVYDAGGTRGIYFTATQNCVAANNNCEENTIGLGLYNCRYCVVDGNNCFNNSSVGIQLGSGSDFNLVVGNTCVDNGDEIVLDSADQNTITGNTCEGGTSEGIKLNSSHYNTVTGNNCRDGNLHGISLVSSNNNTITGNTCCFYSDYGISINNSHHNVISSNHVNSNSQATDNLFANIDLDGADYNLVEANVCRMGVLANQPSYGIELDADCDHNIVRDNDLYDSGKTGPINDLGVDTEFNNITFQFIQGTTFIDADGSAKGWEIDLADEFAIALGQLPLELTQVVRIKIWAVGLAAPGAGNQMELEINMNAGQDDEAYTAEAIAIINKLNTTENFAIGDIIHWVLTSADDADIGDLAGGDSLEVKVKFETGTNSDIDTDAVFRVVEIEYVP